MKRLISLAIIFSGLLFVSVKSYAEEKLTAVQQCEIAHFIGTGETMDLSFSVCKDVLASRTFTDSFMMDCQHGLVTYHMKQRPTAKYLRIGNDGNPVHCSST